MFIPKNFILYFEILDKYSLLWNALLKGSTSTNRWIRYIRNWHVKSKVKEAKLMQIETLSFNTQLNRNEFFFTVIWFPNISDTG